MICPDCRAQLPFTFALATVEKKQQCPVCKNSIIPTEKSMSEIKLVTGTFSFVLAVPLGAFSVYLWAELAEPLSALYFLVFGSGGVLSAVSVYSKYRIRFRQAWFAPPGES